MLQGTLRSERLQFGAGGECLVGVVTAGGLADDAEAEDFNRFRQLAGKALTVFEAGGVGGAGGGIIGQFAERLPGPFGADLISRRGLPAEASNQPPSWKLFPWANTTRPTVTGSSSSTPNQSCGARLRVKGGGDSLEIVINDRPGIGLARTNLDAVHQEVPVRARRLDRGAKSYRRCRSRRRRQTAPGRPSAACLVSRNRWVCRRRR